MAEKKKTTKKETPKKSGVFKITKSNGNVIERTDVSGNIRTTYEAKGWKVEEVLWQIVEVDIQ